MSNINFIIYEALFRAKGLAQKFRPSVIAYKLTHCGSLPDRKIVANSSKTNKLFNNRLFDSNLDPEWINRLFESSHVPSNFDISGGFDSNNVAYISFQTNLTSRLKEILNSLSQVNNVFVDINDKEFNIPRITIAGNIWFQPGHHNSLWEHWFDTVTSILKDESY